MWALAYIMIFNLYPMKNLSGPRTIFLFDLFTHKEIDIYGHIYHLFIKSITKRKSRLTLSFPKLVMSLILRARVKIPSGLQVMQREDPISEQTIIWSKAHIPELTIGVSQIPRDDADEEGDIEKEIEHFTSVLEDTAQHSSQARARVPNRLDHLIGRIKEMHVMLASQSATPHLNSHTLKARSLSSRLKLMTWWGNQSKS